KVIFLISAHLESGHYFNPHAQRVMDGKTSGAKLIVFDTRLSNTATHADHYISPYPGSEAAILLSIANYLIQNNLYNREFVRRWWNWEEYLEQRPEVGGRRSETAEQPRNGEMFIAPEHNDPNEADPSINISRSGCEDKPSFDELERILKELYAEYTFEFAANESGVDAK